MNAQKYKNFEVIFVNDGSIDNSLKLLQQYKEVFPLQIRIVDQPNQGVSAAETQGWLLQKVNMFVFVMLMIVSLLIT